MVIDADNKVSYRTVTLGPIVNGLRVIRSGLQKDELIVVQRSATRTAPTPSSRRPKSPWTATSRPRRQLNSRPRRAASNGLAARKKGSVNISKFFIDRPIFAGVLSCLILIGGLIAMGSLPISEYPEVVPPSVIVTAQFPGANPETIAETVATRSRNRSKASRTCSTCRRSRPPTALMTLTITFKLGTNPDLAAQLVQNRVNQALPRLPQETQQLGVTTVKSSPDLTMVVHLLSPDGRYDDVYLRNYAVINVKDRLARLQGIGDVRLFGSGDYAMRIWLDPRKVAERNLSADDVVTAI